MAELAPVKLPRAAIGDEVVVTTEEHGQAWNIVSTNRAKTRRRLRAVTAALLPPPVDPPPPVTGRVVLAGRDDIRTLLGQGVRDFVLDPDGGPFPFALGSGQHAYDDVSFMPFPGKTRPILDGGGATNMVYLRRSAAGSGQRWTFGAIECRNYRPSANGAIGVVEGFLKTLPGFKLIGPGGAASNKDHGVYFSGTGGGDLDTPDIGGFPGSGVQTYLPQGVNRPDYPNVIIRGGKVQGGTVAVYAYSGVITFDRVVLLGGASGEVNKQAPGTIVGIGTCTTPTGAAPRVTTST